MRHPTGPVTKFPQPAALRRWLLPLAFLAGILLVASCGRVEEQAPASAAQGVVDSILPIAEEIRRFVTTVDSVPTTLHAGAPSRDALVAEFVRAVEAMDTLALSRLVLQRDEFIGVYYPYTQFTHPPYELSPSLLWFQMQNRSDRGITRLLRRDAGQPLGYRSYRCDAEPREEGGNRLWEGCVVVVADSAGGSRERKLFGGIMERDGTFKFLTFANEY